MDIETKRVQFILDSATTSPIIPDWAYTVELQPNEVCECDWEHRPNETPRFVNPCPMPPME